MGSHNIYKLLLQIKLMFCVCLNNLGYDLISSNQVEFNDLFCQITLNTPLLNFNYHVRLVHDGESAYFINHLKSMITMTLWFAFANFFKNRSKASIYKMCPNGSHALIGGKQQRNLHTLGKNI